MRIIVEINDDVIRHAARLVEQYCTDYDFLDVIRKLSFNHTEDSGEEVAATILEKSYVVIRILPYKTLNPFSKVIGYADYKNKIIYVNTRKNLDLMDRVENIFHEFCHIAGYSHKGNRVTEYNLRTVPYLAANEFVKFLKSRN